MVLPDIDKGWLETTVIWQPTTRLSCQVPLAERPEALINYHWLIISIKCGRWTNLVRVPVTVKDDDSVGSLQVEAEATGSGAEQEDEVLRSFFIEFLQKCRSVLRLGGSWNIQHDQFEMPRLVNFDKVCLNFLILWSKVYCCQESRNVTFKLCLISDQLNWFRALKRARSGSNYAWFKMW